MNHLSQTQILMTNEKDKALINFVRSLYRYERLLRKFNDFFQIISGHNREPILVLDTVLMPDNIYRKYYRYRNAISKYYKQFFDKDMNSYAFSFDDRNYETNGYERFIEPMYTRLVEEGVLEFDVRSSYAPIHRTDSKSSNTVSVLRF